MNIGIIHNFNSYPPQNGRSSHFYNLVLRLIKNGHIIHSLDQEKLPGIKNLYPNTKEGIIEICNKADLLYIRVDGNIEKQVMLRSLFKKKPIIWELNAPLEEEIVWWQNIPSRFNHLRSRIDLRYNNFIRKRLASFVDYSICTCSELQKYSKEFLNIKNSFTITMGADYELFKPELRKEDIFGIPEGKYKVFWAGDIFPWQNFDLIYEIAKNFLKTDPDIYFILLMPKSNKLPFIPLNNMKIFEKIAYKDIPNYFASADVSLCLYCDSYWSPWGFTRSPIKLFDYMASGSPVIASDMGQVGRIIKDNKNGLLTNNDVNDIINKITILKGNKQLAKNIAINARDEVVKYYNWDRVAKQTEILLEIALNKTNNRNLDLIAENNFRETISS
ncbi:MAG: glycosyltransferase family 4 protein [bacterium]|nr:glycosyltransferase family 4 protein [bacterium]